jgi:hypothetical protein
VSSEKRKDAASGAQPGFDGTAPAAEISVNLKIKAMDWVTYATSDYKAAENLRAWETLGTILTQRGSLVGKKTYRGGATAFASTIPVWLMTDTALELL